jgi:aryl-alcohol dehydrogenase-like predicted oxidoreductase
VRDRVVIATKAGHVLPARRRALARLKPFLRPLIRVVGLRRESLPAAVRGAPTQDFSPRYLRHAVEGSLRRLGTDRLDLFQLHSPPEEVIERAEWLPGLEQLKREGKILHFGVACDTVADALLALRQPGISSLQVTINLLERGAVDSLLPAVRAKGVAVIARECLANGLLVKDAAEVDLKDYCRSPEEVERRTRQLAAVRTLAAATGCAVPQLALRFVQGLEGVSVALVGGRSAGQLEGLLRLREGGPVALEALGGLPS